MMTRRHFMGALSAVAAAGSLGLGSVFAYRRRLSLPEIVPTAVLPMQGTAVSMSSDDGFAMRCVLENVTTARRQGRFGAPDTEQISLLMKPGNTEAVAGNYRVTTDEIDLGELNFLPVGRPGRERRLEAVITRIV